MISNSDTQQYRPRSGYQEIPNIMDMIALIIIIAPVNYFLLRAGKVKLIKQGN